MKNAEKVYGLPDCKEQQDNSDGPDLNFYM